ncbi:MAG: hypothetical protein NVSMB14_03800 [Isosphaeraceae bacterium]
MRQRWASLLFLHWEVPIEQLRPLVPRELEIDTFEGRAYVGLVPFTMTGVRPVLLPAIPKFSDFHEINVRTYVHFRGRDPGVWFFSLDAANPIAVVLARLTYKLPYFHAKMSLDPGDRMIQRRLGQGVESPFTISYKSERLHAGPVRAVCDIQYEPTGAPRVSEADSLEHFLAERYILYVSAYDRLYSGRVHHSPYPLQTARLLEFNETLVAAAGIDRGDEPPIAHFAREVHARIYPLKKIDVGSDRDKL